MVAAAAPAVTSDAFCVRPALKLDGMADAFIELQSQNQAAELAHAEWLSQHQALPNPAAH
jgi:hypothetical protein